jgi:PEP-CTERM motif
VLDRAYPGAPESGQDQVHFFGITSDWEIAGALLHSSANSIDTLQGVRVPVDPSVYRSFPDRFLMLGEFSREENQLFARLHSFDPVSPSPVPEPASVVLLTTGFSALAWRVRRSRPRRGVS